MTNQTAFEAFAERDLWKEARDYTASLKQPWYMRLLAWFLRLFMRLKIIRSFGGADRLMAVDLNKYRADIDVEMLIDQGVRVFMLRVGGPLRWVHPAEPVMDDTFVPYYERIRAYAKQVNKVVFIIGYGVHNAWSNSEGNYLGLDPQVKWLKEATRNHLCDAYCWDDEVGTIWMNGKETTITANNLVRSMSICMEQTYMEMERSPLGAAYHKMPVHYSANWFMQKYALSQYQTWLDNNNRDITNRHFLTWRAWIPNVITEVFQTIGAMFDRIITPTGLQENKYLRMGSELAADFWQCIFTARGPWCGAQSKDAGIDASLGYGPSKTLKDFAYCANLPLVTEPLPDTTPPTKPGALVGHISDSLVMLAWQPSEDDRGVKEYVVCRAGAEIGRTTETAFSEQAPIDGTYIYAVTAVDAAGNRSEPALLTVTVGTPPPGEYATVEELYALGARVYEMRQDIVEALTALAAKLGQGL